MSDGIEIRYDDRRGYLELACEPDAFALYREVAHRQLSGFSEIPIEKVTEINVINSAASSTSNCQMLCSEAVS